MPQLEDIGVDRLGRIVEDAASEVYLSRRRRSALPVLGSITTNVTQPQPTAA